jgi:hypothetical protein
VAYLKLGTFWKEEGLGFMEEALDLEREAFRGPTFHLQAQRFAKSAKTLP